MATSLNRRPWVALAWLLAALVGAWAGAAQPDGETGKVGVRAVPQKAAVARGQNLTIAVELDHPPKLHTWPNAKVKLDKALDEFATRTEIFLDPVNVPKAVTLAGIQWPVPHPGDVSDPTGNALTVKAPVFAGKAVAYVVVQIAPDAALGELHVPLVVSYQACDDKLCYPGVKAKLDVLVTVASAAGTESAAANEPTLFAGFDEKKIESEGSARATVPPAVSPPSTTAPATVVVPDRTLLGFGVGSSLLVIALASILGGAILNLTPCVLPIIPIKVMSLVEHAGNPKRRLVLGTWMTLGVVAFWIVVGLPMVFVSSLDPTRFLFGHWWITMGIGLLIALMGLGIMGLFNINLPQSVYMINPKADTPHGSFLFGVMAGVLGLPCFGFVAGGLLAGAAALSPLTIMVIFTCLGIGMGAPYLILALKPGLIQKIPRTGPASELVKQVMGLLILAAAGLFVTVGFRTLMIDKPYLTESLPYWVVAFFILLAGLWLTLRVLSISKKPWPKVVMPLLSLLMVAGIVRYAYVSTAADRADYEMRLAGNVSWQPFTKAALDQGLADHKVVVIDFTAGWCINCKFLKRRYLDRDPVFSRLRKGDVVILEADLSSEEDPGWDFLHSLGQTGVPTLAIYGPAITKPLIYNAYTSDTVMDAIEQAKGSGSRLVNANQPPTGP
jgi:thiol:disulfide interchange protein DsbD